MFLTIATMLTIHSAQAMQSEAPVSLRPESQILVEQESIKYRFQIYDSESGKFLGESDLEITHEKVLHFIVYDKALEEFQHVHPTFDGQYWNVTLNFSASGEYKLWAQGKILNGDEFSAPSDLRVQVGKAAWPTPPRLPDVRVGEVGNSVATLDGSRLKAGSMAMLDLTFTRNDGTQAEITPYLGAFAHVISVSDDASELTHVHPMDGNRENEGILHVTFPHAGFYRLWIQFIDGGVLRTVPLAVQVF